MHVKAMVIFQGASGLPEDRFVNNFHFENPGADLDLASAAISGGLYDFYEAVPTGGTKSIGALLSPYVQRPYEVRFYDMGQLPNQRVPVIGTSTLPAVDTGSTGGLPAEVAIVCSFHGDPPVTPRTRGRVYIGPLNTAAVDMADTVSPARVDLAKRNVFVGAMSDLALLGSGWCVYSPTADLLTPVTGGFCDDAPDTQRRRGVAPVTRAIWPV